jgi:very-short-patch-repair endonuclease
MPHHDPRKVADRLEASRRNLLDISRRNRLIHYRTPKASGVEMVGEDPAEVYRLLVLEGRTLTFRGRPDAPEAAATSPQGEAAVLFVDDYGDAPSLHEMRLEAEKELEEFLGTGRIVDSSDLVLECEERESKLKPRLLKTLRDARTVLEETGVNVLFLALGMLEWAERDDPSKPRRSPLLLVPVELERRPGDKYRVRYDGGEIGENLSLQAMMRQEFGLDLPALGDPEVLDVRAFLHLHERAHGGRSGWQVDTGAVVLGFFSYAKYLLYADLAEDRWPEDRLPRHHPVLGALLDSGFDDIEEGVPDDAPLDELRPVRSCHEVSDCDGSQALVVLEASSGRSMVVQGPPGTGKSQTITNLLSDAIARGRRVLFVSEKLAALEVVARRMEASGLRDACLELHSHQARKTDFYQELLRVQQLAPFDPGYRDGELDRLEERRAELNEYARSLNEPVGDKGVSPRQAIGWTVAAGPADPSLSEDGMPRSELAEVPNWTGAELQERLPYVRRLEAKVREIGPPCANPLFGSQLAGLFPADRSKLDACLGEAHRALQEASTRSCELSEAMAMPVPESLDAARRWIAAAQSLGEAPDLEGVTAADPDWERLAGEIRESTSAGRRAAEVRGAWGERLLESAWTADVSIHHRVLLEHGAKWWAFARPDVRSAARALDAVARSPMASHGIRAHAAGAILAVQEARRVLERHGPMLQGLLRLRWKGESTDWDWVERVLGFVLDIRHRASRGEIPDAFLSGTGTVVRGAQLAAIAHQCERAVEVADGALQRLGLLLELDSAGLERWKNFTMGVELLAAAIDRPSSLDDLIGFNVGKQEASRIGLERIVFIAERWADAGTRLVEAVERTWHEGLLRQAFSERPLLARWDRKRHELVASEFRDLDRLLIRSNRRWIAAQHLASVPRTAIGGAMGWLQHQMRLKRRQAPIRQAMTEAGPVIQAIKPIFMMSPLSVAMYLPPDGPVFDLVIFDEASQVRPEDAFGAILRGRQVVVVGDSRQMPPTSFFERLTSGDDETGDEENLTRDLESVLSLMDSKVAPRSPRRRDLRWHYRSLHHSLIAPSNHLFYDRRLFLFPNPQPPGEEMGLRLHLLPDTVYGRGGSRINREEARAVAHAVAEHCRKRPGESLMVVAFSQAQQQAIQEELDTISQRETAVEVHSSRHPTERLDVKNLENVQGDERDVVFISVGYGRDAAGKVAMSFGPLNQEGGERRLNVLITRARKRCEVWSNISGDDIRADEGSPMGVQALKKFLAYAAGGALEVDDGARVETSGSVEESVAARLSADGWFVERNIGVAGFFVDLAVRDRDDPSRLLLGIEGDGPQYHQTRNARDRDRLREEVLRSRGWRLHRVWSADWWSRQEDEYHRLLAALLSARSGDDGGGPPDGPSPDGTFPARSSEGAPAHSASDREEESSVARERVETPSASESAVALERLRADPYRVAPPEVAGEGLVPGLLTASGVAERILEVVSHEGPVHRDEVMRRIREGIGLGRISTELKEVFRQALWTIEGKRLENSNEFLSLPGVEARPRDRSHLPSAMRRIELVAESEIAAALATVVEQAFEIAPAEACSEAARLLGFARQTDTVRATFGFVLEGMIREGALTAVGDRIQKGR